MQTTSFSALIREGKIPPSKVIVPSMEIDYRGNWGNDSFRDIFGEYHLFFRQYKTNSKEYCVNFLPNGFCFPNQEIVFSQDKSIVVDQTSYRIHPLVYSKGANKREKIKNVLRNIYVLMKRIRVSVSLIFAKKIQGNVALLRRDIECCYGHAIAEVVAGFIQVQEFSKRSKIEIDYYIFPTAKKFHQDLIKILGIPQDKILSTNSKRAVCAKGLIVPTIIDDYEIVEYRKFLHYRGRYPIYFIADFYNSLIPKRYLPNKKIFLRRPKKSNRNIINSSEVEQVFLDFGYEIILPDGYSLEKQIEIFQQAKCIASMHGSGLDNVLFAHDEIYIFEIFSEFYHDSSPMNKCISKKCHYYYMIGKTEDRSMHPQQESVYVEIDMLKKALKILDEAMHKKEKGFTPPPPPHLF